MGYVTYPEYLRHGELLGKNTDIYVVSNGYFHIEVRDSRSLELASNVPGNVWEDVSSRYPRLTNLPCKK